jgi:hypothetical protein
LDWTEALAKAAAANGPPRKTKYKSDAELSSPENVPGGRAGKAATSASLTTIQATITVQATAIVLEVETRLSTPTNKPPWAVRLLRSHTTPAATSGRATNTIAKNNSPA